MKYDYVQITNVVIQAIKNSISMRIHNRKNRPIFANCFPKAGTHLFKNILLNMDSSCRLAIGNEIKPYHYDGRRFKSKKFQSEFDRGNFSVLRDFRYNGHRLQTRLEWKSIFKSSDDRTIILGHIDYNETIKNLVHDIDCPVIFLYRDPRDIVVSRAHSLMKKGASSLAWHFQTLHDFNLIVRKVITGDKNYREDHLLHNNINDTFRKWMGWMRDKHVLAIRYEDLISEDKISILSQIVKHCNLQPTEDRINRMLSAYSIKPHTYRKGVIGSWKEDLNEENKNLFKDVAGQLLIELGYEEDLNW